MAMLARLSGVSKTFANGTLALRGLDLTIGDGEFLTLLGPSGCGKSTALRLLAGLMPPSEGTVRWQAGAAREIGFVFQDPTLMPWASVFDNVWLPLRLRNQSRKAAAKEIEQALALVGLADVAHVYPRELSGGMKMRASIARALVTHPPLLLLDEPFAALDEITRFKLNNDLLRLKTELGTTVVFVTHSVFESVYLSSRIAVFSARPGRVIAEIDIPEPLPRDESFRLSPAYAEHCRIASQALQRAMPDQAA
ncbi:ABC transporter ATP-binding protein [Methylocella sp. CPCC 101449]|uniref:ABC transporter ATP-binding protein n=1 Tax=Methylocella sp. CPCC 101449 TaxID=2987531 RepID=UPI00288E641A|nr:ABC transporter ATP-binding protein [Methylocella sp. CPCC 101449]MDT2023160.1 ABC transporter ATP-binding protein [Methylocella sp. CPCC 101449]